MTCPVPNITEEQRSAIKPWAIGILVAEVLLLASWASLAIYLWATSTSDVRVLGAWGSLSWLAARGYQDYCYRQMARIVGESSGPGTGMVRWDRTVLFHRITTAVMFAIFMVSVLAFFL